MSGSGKTGLITVLVEEALRNEIPVLLLDVKGDLANLKLAFPSFAPSAIAPWVEAARGDADNIADAPLVAEVAAPSGRRSCSRAASLRSTCASTARAPTSA